ncbi:hypothetical protein [Staphylococcus hyicus]|uniref:hypothetical protein n=1 Tax=Staphylococcus hyicus TaxID=1284 RepID=UPI0023653495|nr:hypothetical protein [Staphylococcus hyicus]
MRKFFRVFVILSICLIALSACGNDKSSKKKEDANKDKDVRVTLADVLNDKSERKIMLAHDKGYYESPEIIWAGTIGNGKVEAHPYTNYDGFTVGDVIDLSMDDYKKKLSEIDEEYRQYGKNPKKKIDFKPVPAKVLLLQSWDKQDKAKAVGLYHEGEFYDKNDEYELIGRGYDQVRMDVPKGWLGLAMQEEDKKQPYFLYVEAKDNESSFELDNIEKTKKKYKDVEVYKEK